MQNQKQHEIHLVHDFLTKESVGVAGNCPSKIRTLAQFAPKIAVHISSIQGQCNAV